MTNTLFYGDNLQVLRDHLPSASVDLVYLDPPFNSNANYNILFKSRTHPRRSDESAWSTWRHHAPKSVMTSSRTTLVGPDLIRGKAPPFLQR